MSIDFNRYNIQLENGILSKDANMIKNSLDFFKKEYNRTQHKVYIERILRCYTAMCTVEPHKSLEYLNEAMLYDNGNPIILNNLAYTYHKDYNDINNAIKIYEKCISTVKGFVTPYLGLIDIARQIGQKQLEQKYIKEGLESCPDDPDLLNIFAIYLTDNVHDIQSALIIFKKAIKFSKTKNLNTKIYLNIGHLYSVTGSSKKAISNLIKSLIEDPKNTKAMQNILLNIHYFTDVRDLEIILDYFNMKTIKNLKDAIKAIHIKIGQEMSKTWITGPISIKKERKDGPIRIAYVSGDLVGHAVSFFTWPLFNEHSDKFEIFIYSEAMYTKEELVKIGFKNISNYRFTANWYDYKVSQMLDSDEIDILIDLSGHTANNRLSMFSNNNLKMYSYVGYPNILGLPNITRISDEFTEKYNNDTDILKLDRLFLTYRPKFTEEEYTNLLNSVKPRDSINLMCLAKLSKINDNVINTFVKILDKLSLHTKKPIKLYLKNKYFQQPDISNNILDKFGLHRNKIVLLDLAKDQDEHLKTFLLADIHLDTFPYSGTTISSESLYMGVPVVTLIPETGPYTAHVSRVTGSILTSIGLPEFCAKSVDEYIDITVKYCTGYISTKREIHDKFMSGPITDYKGFMSAYEKLIDTR